MYRILTFAELAAPQLYAILALRSKIFVVEQNIAYLDADGYDDKCLHVCRFQDDALIAYTRIVPPGVKFDEPSIGRIVVAKEHRGKDIGSDIILYSAEEIWRRYGDRPIHIEGQSHLQKYYESLGFKALTEPYMLEGLMHVKMAMEPPASRKLHAG